SCRFEVSSEFRDWSIYGGDFSGSRYSSLNQINKENVKDLKPLWTLSTGDAFPGSTIQCNPIMANGRLYIVSAGLKLMALEPMTGEVIWQYDPFGDEPASGTSRGITFWTDGHDERLYYGVGYFLVALHAKSGEIISSFGDQGRIDLHSGLGDEAKHMWINLTTPGVIHDDLLIIGSRVGEGPAQAAPGHIRAFDVRSGELIWIFRTIPAQGEDGSDTWTASTIHQMGGANSWGGFTLDTDRGIVFCGTGSAAYDHWGGNRIGNNLFANCILALNAKTGERIWHYQVVHHDIWDYDIPCPPNLVQVKQDGKLIDAVAQPTKMGHLFVLHRETGEPIFPVKEEPVPQSTIPGEKTSATQPFPHPSLRYGRQQFTEADITDISPEVNRVMQGLLSDFTLGSIFLPPGTNPTITIPQFNGGTDWGGAAYDPVSRMLYVNSSNEAEYISMVPAKPATEISQYDFGIQLYRGYCSSCHGNQTPSSLGAPRLNGLKTLASAITEDSLKQIIQIGRGLMPAFRQFSDIELEAILAMLKDEGHETMLDSTQIASLAVNIPWIDRGHEELKDPGGFPANKRPWGTLNAIDLDQGEIAWQVPLGTYPELEARGFPPTGTFNMGGPIVTAGGLVFIAATMDERIRAFDKETGAVLWEYQMDAGGYATPATFEIAGRQLLIIGAGGGGKPGTKSGDTYYCFGIER
ncbi:MAG: PQQ-binding-like beta-propeller repeat protein, partial [Saprospiraceae bacterium]|nr:PQQ-binding-like beta-propeller repeat protein [Saprospiraceae bacterium]